MRGLEKLVGKLYEYGIADVRVEFGNAVSLHKNYYHPWMDRATVEANLGQVRRLIEKMEEAIERNVEERAVPPFIPDTKTLARLLEQIVSPLETVYRTLRTLLQYTPT